VGADALCDTDVSTHLPLSCTIGFAPRIRFWIVSSPYLTIYCLGLWRIFTNVFSEPGPIDALLAAWWISVYWSDMECTKGSVRLLHCFAFVYLGGGTCSLAICMMLGVWPVDEDNPHPLYNDNVKSFFVNQLHEGLWAPILGLLAARCISSEERTCRFLCFPMQVPADWYPIIVLLLLTLFSPRRFFENLFCMLAGYFYVIWGLQPPIEKIRDWEARYFGRSYCCPRHTFISVDRTRGSMAAHV